MVSAHMEIIHPYRTIIEGGWTERNQGIIMLYLVWCVDSVLRISLKRMGGIDYHKAFNFLRESCRITSPQKLP